jgi:hypothetical protein
MKIVRAIFDKIAILCLGALVKGFISGARIFILMRHFNINTFKFSQYFVEIIFFLLK